MADYYVDGNAAGPTHDGSTPTYAWTSIKTALEYASFSPGDKIWIRREDNGSRFVEVQAADINTADLGTIQTPISFIGWPRAAQALSQADWTNGSTTVDNVVGANLAREAHEARYITAPDGETYFITDITDTNTLVIDREYAGSTVTGTNGACSVDQDEDYDDRPPAAGTSAGWDSDGDDVPCIDFNESSLQLYLNGDDYYVFKALEFKDSTDTYGCVRVNNNTGTPYFRNCLFANASGSGSCIRCYGGTELRACTLENPASSGRNLEVFYSGVRARDCALKGGDYGVYISYGKAILNNVNIGVEAACDLYAIYSVGFALAVGIDVQIGSGDLAFSPQPGGSDTNARYEILNYGKVLGAHKVVTPQGTITRTAVVAGSGDPYKRTGGGDNVMTIQFDQSSTGVYAPSAPFRVPLNAPSVAPDQAASEHTYKVYVQAEDSIDADELVLVARYVSSHDDSSEYTHAEARSTESITVRSGASDWSQYLSVTLTPATASDVELWLECSYYDSGGNLIHVDHEAVDVS